MEAKREQVYVGIDKHEKSILAKMAAGKENPVHREFGMEVEDQKRFRAWVTRCAGIRPVIAAYEASFDGCWYAQELKGWGWECHIVAPHSLDRSPKRRSQKCDVKDAERVLEALRNHYLAGSKLRTCLQPDVTLRDDRELVRSRIDIGQKIGTVKSQITHYCKRNRIKRPEEMKTAWTQKHVSWLKEVAEVKLSLPVPLGLGAREALACMIGQLEHLQAAEARLDEAMAELAREARYVRRMEALRKARRGGVVTRLTYLVEMGPLERFKNRKQIGAFIGIVPGQDQSGEKDHKGHITHQGSWRIRKVLNQTAWMLLRSKDPWARSWFTRVAARRGRKVALVGLMRQLAIRMWHESLAA
jgi:transposase